MASLAMTVGELRAVLAGLPDEMLIGRMDGYGEMVPVFGVHVATFIGDRPALAEHRDPDFQGLEIETMNVDDADGE